MQSKPGRNSCNMRANCRIFGKYAFFTDGTSRRLHGYHAVALFEQVIQPAVQGVVAAPGLLQQLPGWIRGMGGPRTALVDIERSRLGNAGIVIEADMRIGSISTDQPLPEFVS